MNLLDPVVAFFLLGLIAGLARADLRLPTSIYDFISMLLLLAIGLKGGVELAGQNLGALLPQIAAVILLGITLPLLAFPVLTRLGHLPRADAASIAAHYGSVSIGTFAVAVAYLSSLDVSFEAHMPVLLVVLEIPAIMVGVLLARHGRQAVAWRPLAHEVLLGRSIVLMSGGLFIGWILGPQGIAPIRPLFIDLFKGILALYLLEMGLIAASQVGSLRRHGLFLVSFGIVMPLTGALIGGVLGWLLDLSVGGTALLATMAASASYIAVPAAMRMAVPEAKPALSLGAALGVTFPFNIFVGIGLYYAGAQYLHGVGG